MKRADWTRWSLAALVVLLAVGSASWLTWRRLSRGSDASIVFSEQHAASPKVENGSAYDRGAVDPGAVRKLVLPDDAVIRRSGEADKIEVYMKKTLAFGGHPPERMSIRDARRNMGCAVKAEEGALVIATFGEWDSHIEGGAFMRVLVVVPKEMELEHRKDLSGESSAGRAWNGQWLSKPRDAKGGYWYGPASPAEGWAAIPDVPDNDRTAQGLEPPTRPNRTRR